MKVKWIDIGKPDIIIKEEVYEVTSLDFTRVNVNDFLKEGNEEEIISRIRKVIDTEAPITEWLLIKRVINSFNIQKAGIHIRKKMFDILDQIDLNINEEYDMTIYWKDTQRIARYKTYRVPGYNEESIRDVTNVPIIEISNVVYKVLQEEGNLIFDDLARLTALKLGYTRMGSNVKKATKRGIEMALERYPIEKSGNFYCAYNDSNMLK